MRVATDLVSLQEVEAVTVMTAPFVQDKRGLVSTIRRSIKYEGVLATFEAAVRSVLPDRDGQSAAVEDRQAEAPSIRGPAHFTAFESREALSHLNSFGADLGVIAGTYILPPEVFDAPSMGSINLHTGKVPEYRGSAPGFWELYNGEDHVGVTIHSVTEELDAGDILLQRMVPLDRAPSIDPLAYLEEYRSAVLLPRGLQLLRLAVKLIGQGSLEGKSQDTSQARTFPKPTISHKRDLQRKIRERRSVKE